MHPDADPRIVRLSAVLAAHRARRVADTPGMTRAAVALVVRPEPGDLEILLIKRAPRVGDPWSGHMALPGGRRDPADVDSFATATRETLEEVGIDLQRVGRSLAPLDEVQPLGAGVPPIAISPFSFAVLPGTAATPNAEVAEAMWVPVGELTSPVARAEYLHELTDGRSLRFPALSYRGETIWGLTHRILTQFITVAALASEAER